MKSSIRDEAKRLASRPYTVRVIVDNNDPDEILYVAENPELDGCMAQGTTIQEAEENLNEFRVDYIEHLLTHNLPIPYPSSTASVTVSSVAVTLSNVVIKQHLTKLAGEGLEQAELQEALYEASFYSAIGSTPHE